MMLLSVYMLKFVFNIVVAVETVFADIFATLSLVVVIVEFLIV